MKQLSIITPRGQNIGKNIISNLQSLGLYKAVDINTIVTRRNPIERVNITTLSYTFVQ